jgi:hypothetical protein
MACVVETCALVFRFHYRSVASLVAHTLRQWIWWDTTFGFLIDGPVGQLQKIMAKPSAIYLAVRGNRKVKFRGGVRDGIVFEEDGRKVRIFSELLTGKISRGFHVNRADKEFRRDPA